MNSKDSRQKNDRKSFSEHLKSHYQSKSLAPEQLRTLNHMMESNENPSTRRNFLRFALAASLAAILIFSYREVTKDPIQAIMQEIAENHQAANPPSIETREISEIQAHLDQLDFRLIRSNRLASLGFQVTGARYCSIDGKTAAQFKAERASGIATFYQVPLPTHLELRTPVINTIEGIRVELWQESGMLLGIAY